MRALYVVNRWINVGIISIGDWALKKRGRPLIVTAVFFTLIHLVAWGLLSLMELAFRH